MSGLRGVPLLARFDAQHIPEPNSGCWLWIGSQRRGYGLIWDAGKQWLAHRVSWVIHSGAIPDGMHVLHKCDTPPCVNPQHLFLGTHAQNMADRDRKGRNKPCRSMGSKTHCIRGHELSGSNLRIRRDRTGRVCRACESVYRSESKAKTHAVLPEGAHS